MINLMASAPLIHGIKVSCDVAGAWGGMLVVLSLPAERLPDGKRAIGLCPMPLVPFVTHEAGLPEEAVELPRVLGPKGQQITQGQVGIGRGGIACKIATPERVKLPSILGGTGLLHQRGIIEGE